MSKEYWIRFENLEDEPRTLRTTDPKEANKDLDELKSSRFAKRIRAYEVTKLGKNEYFNEDEKGGD